MSVNLESRRLVVNWLRMHASSGRSSHRPAVPYKAGCEGRTFWLIQLAIP
jgi:hypothetical protein